MKKSIVTLQIVSLVQLASVMSASAATALVGTAVPDVIDGVQNLNYSTGGGDLTAIPGIGNNYLAGDNNASLGQTFTTGSNVGGYSLSAISLRQVSWGTTYWDYTGGTITLQIFQWDSANAFPGAHNITQLSLETATVGGEIDGITYSQGVPDVPRWLTVSLDSPVTLAANAMYGFQIMSNGTGGNDQFFIQPDGTNTNTYSNGFAIGTPNISGLPDTGAVWDGGNGQPGDRSFVATMTAVPEPSAALLGGLAFLTLLRRRK